MRVQKSALSAEVVTMATDAFRICIGIKPRNHSAEEVIRWMRFISERTA